MSCARERKGGERDRVTLIKREWGVAGWENGTQVIVFKKITLRKEIFF